MGGHGLLGQLSGYDEHVECCTSVVAVAGTWTAESVEVGEDKVEVGAICDFYLTGETRGGGG